MAPTPPEDVTKRHTHHIHILSNFLLISTLLLHVSYGESVATVEVRWGVSDEFSFLLNLAYKSSIWSMFSSIFVSVMTMSYGKVASEEFEMFFPSLFFAIGLASFGTHSLLFDVGGVYDDVQLVHPVDLNPSRKVLLLIANIVPVSACFLGVCLAVMQITGHTSRTLAFFVFT